MQDLIGQDLGRYHIIERLGEGGMATVYKAFDTRLEREVAVKVIRREAFSPEVVDRMLQRFEREAKALSKLTHANIVPIIDYGDEGGSPYLVMPLIDGGTLKDKLANQVFSVAEAAKILAPIARALDYAHSRGILHRDVKPSNILITNSGDPMLSDFGVAKILEEGEAATLTGTGIGLGTPEYMAPEQWVGKAVPASDQYSLGVVFYEMITGHKPYTAETPAAVLLKQANEPLPRPSEFVKNIPAVAEQILFKTLAKKPENRYQSMAEFVSVLEKLFFVSSPAHNQIERSSLSPSRSQSTITFDGFNSEITNKGKITPRNRLFLIGGLIVLAVIITGILVNKIQERKISQYASAESISTQSTLNQEVENPTITQTTINPSVTLVPTQSSTLAFTTLFKDSFFVDSLSQYELVGNVSWNENSQDIYLGNGILMDNKMLLPYRQGFDNDFMIQGKITIPQRQYEWYESAAVSIISGDQEYWATILFGNTGDNVHKISFMCNDVWSDNFVEFNPTPGEYWIKVKINRSSSLLQMKVWAIDSMEPGWQLSEHVNPDMAIDQIGFRHYGRGVEVDEIKIFKDR